MTYDPPRRQFLKIGGATAAAAVIGAAAGTGVLDSSALNALTTSKWKAVETPTGNTLYDVEHTTDDAYAVGGGGVVIRRTSDGWSGSQRPGGFKGRGGRGLCRPLDHL